MQYTAIVNVKALYPNVREICFTDGTILDRNKFALDGQIIKMNSVVDAYGYDFRAYSPCYSYWKREWLRDIRPVVDWSKVPVDTKVEVSDNNQKWHRRYFKQYAPDTNWPFHVFPDGGTSWSATQAMDRGRQSFWKFCRLWKKNEK